MKHSLPVLYELLLGQTHRLWGDEVEIHCLTGGHSGFLKGLGIRGNSLPYDPLLDLHRKTVLQAHLYKTRKLLTRKSWTRNVKEICNFLFQKIVWKYAALQQLRVKEFQGGIPLVGERWEFKCFYKNFTVIDSGEQDWPWAWDPWPCLRVWHSELCTPLKPPCPPRKPWCCKNKD